MKKAEFEQKLLDKGVNKDKIPKLSKKWQTQYGTFEDTAPEFRLAPKQYTPNYYATLGDDYPQNNLISTTDQNNTKLSELFSLNYETNIPTSLTSSILNLTEPNSNSEQALATRKEALADPNINLLNKTTMTGGENSYETYKPYYESIIEKSNEPNSTGQLFTWIDNLPSWAANIFGLQTASKGLFDIASQAVRGIEKANYDANLPFEANIPTDLSTNSPLKLNFNGFSEAGIDVDIRPFDPKEVEIRNAEMEKLHKEVGDMVVNNRTYQDDLTMEEIQTGMSDVDKLNTGNKLIEAGTELSSYAIAAVPGLGIPLSATINFGRLYDEGYQETRDAEWSTGYGIIGGMLETALDRMISSLPRKIMKNLNVKTLRGSMGKTVATMFGVSQASGIGEFLTESLQSAAIQKKSTNVINWRQAFNEGALAYMIGVTGGSVGSIQGVRNQSKIRSRLELVQATEQEQVDILEDINNGNTEGAAQKFSVIRDRLFKKFAKQAAIKLDPKNNIDLPDNLKPWTLDRIQEVRDALNDTELDNWIDETFEAPLRDVARKAFKMPSDKTRIEFNRARINYQNRKDSDYDVIDNKIEEESKPEKDAIDPTGVWDAYDLENTDVIIDKDAFGRFVKIDINNKNEILTRQRVEELADYKDGRVILTDEAKDLQNVPNFELFENIKNTSVIGSLMKTLDEEWDIPEDVIRQLLINDTSSDINVTMSSVYNNKSLWDLTKEIADIVKNNGTLPIELTNAVNNKLKNNPFQVKLFFDVLNTQINTKKDLTKLTIGGFEVLPDNEATQRWEAMRNKGSNLFEYALSQLEGVLLPQDKNHPTYVKTAKAYAEKSHDKDYRNHLNHVFIWKRKERVKQVREAVSDAVYQGNIQLLYNQLDKLGINPKGKLAQLLNQATSQFHLAEKVLQESNSLEKTKGRAQVSRRAKENVWQFQEVQEFSSKSTSLNQLAALFTTAKYSNLIFQEGNAILDIGGGKTNLLLDKANENNATAYIFDPYNIVDTRLSNQEVVDIVKNGGVNVVTIANVLNVVQEESARAQILKRADNALADGGTIFISIHKGSKADQQKGSRKTGKDQFQNYKRAKDYIKEIRKVLPNYDIQLDPSNEVLTLKRRPQVVTQNGTLIRRANGIVGKKVGNDLYLHKSYLNQYPEYQDLVKEAKNKIPKNFKYNTLKINTKTGEVRFDQSPDFDTASEPRVGKYITVGKRGKVTEGESNAVWHHKWLWVQDNYKGFNVYESQSWSRTWLSKLQEVAKGGSKNAWQEQLKSVGLAQVSSSGKKVTSKTLNNQVDAALKALSEISPETTILIHKTPEEFFNATGQNDINGWTQDNVIHINETYARETTLPHEVLHIVFNGTFGFDATAEQLALDVFAELTPFLDTETTAFLEEFASNYSENVRNTEMLAELFGIMAANYQEAKPKPKRAINKLIDYVANKVGLGKFVKGNKNKYDLLQTLAGQVSEGKTITKEQIQQAFQIAPKQYNVVDESGNVDTNPIKIEQLQDQAVALMNEFIEKLNLDNLNLTTEQKETIMIYVAKEQGYDAELDNINIDLDSLPQEAKDLLDTWSEMAKEIADRLDAVADALNLPFSLLDGFYFPLRHYEGTGEFGSDIEIALDLALRGFTKRKGKFYGEQEQGGVILDPAEQLRLYLQDASKIIIIGEAKIALQEKLAENPKIAENIGAVLEKYEDNQDLTEYEESVLEQYTDMQNLEEAGVPLGMPRGAYANSQHFDRINDYKKQGTGEDLPNAPQKIKEFLKIFSPSLAKKLGDAFDNWGNIIDPHFILQRMDGSGEIDSQGNLYGQNSILWSRLLQAEALSRLAEASDKQMQMDVLKPIREQGEEALGMINVLLNEYILSKDNKLNEIGAAKDSEQFWKISQTYKGRDRVTKEQSDVIFWYGKRVISMKQTLGLGGKLRSNIADVKRSERAKFLEVEQKLEQGLPVSDAELKKHLSYSVNADEGTALNTIGKMMRWITEKNAINTKDFLGYYDSIVLINNKGGYFYDLVNQMNAWADYLDSIGQKNNAAWWRMKIDSNVIGNVFKFENQLLDFAAERIIKTLKTGEESGDQEEIIKHGRGRSGFSKSVINRLKNMSPQELRASALDAATHLQRARISAFLIGNVGWTLTTQPTSIAFTIKQTGFSYVAKAIAGMITGNSYQTTSNVSKIKGQLKGIDRLEASSEFHDMSIKQTKRAKFRNQLSFFGGKMEAALTDVSYNAGYIYAKQELGLNDTQAKIHGDMVAATTQSMYTRVSRNTALNSQVMRFMQPLQTYVFTAMSNALDTMGVVGRKRSVQTRMAEFARWILTQRLFVVLWSMHFGDDLEKALLNPVWDRAGIGSNIPLLGKKIDIKLSKVIPWQDDRTWQDKGYAEQFVDKTTKLLLGVANNEENWEREAAQYTIRYITPMIGIGGTSPVNNAIRMWDASLDDNRFEGITGWKYADFADDDIGGWANGLLFGIKAVDAKETFK
ncbi:MAG: hypothetical protein Tp118DCM00d2C30442581_5 [Prokaryotic dsDNA virus sp.]|nr:MAG: hypothetical protein Tp118DCM00d2C30442581_5 [Prokaryotic dsDNA virus sp.]|tara:strand:+ start:4445 stop:11839 length:7395 start_codon:yes stop_codon:yes gene_type:complete